MMRLIDPNIGQLGPIHHCLLEESQRENERILWSTRGWMTLLLTIFDRINFFNTL